MLLAAVTGMARAVPLSLGYRFADACSAVHRWVAPGRRRAVDRNLRVLGAPDLDRAVRGVFRNFGRTTFEYLRGPHVPEIDVEFEGLDHLDAALARGRGVIFAVAHTGNWGHAGSILSRRVLISAVANIQLHRRWTPELRRRQEQVGIRILPPGVTSWRELPRILARNEAVALLVDGDVFQGGARLEVDGYRVRFPTGPAKLALRTGAALLPAWAIRRENGSIRLRFEPEVSTDGSPGSVQTATRKLLESLMEHLRSHPDQWVLFRPFFEPADGQVNVGEVK